MNQNLNEYLTCKICQKYFLNPVLLPCYNNICEEHVNELQSYKCDFCQENHQVPQNGFILNRPFIVLMKTNLHLNERTKTAQKQIDDLDILNKEIDLIAKHPEDFVYSYFAMEKNKIDLRREILISKINDISDQMINKIKQMEDDSKSNLFDKATFDTKNLTEGILNWKEEIRYPKLNESRLEQIIKESYILIKENEKQLLEAKKKILNQKGCYFAPNNDEFNNDLFGELITHDFSFNNQPEKANFLPIKSKPESFLICDSNSNSSDQFSVTQFPVTSRSFLSPPRINQSLPIIKLNKNGTIAKKRGPKGPRKNNYF
jgi:hypothetical protein